MSISYNLKLEQTPKLFMTTELRQAIKLLQLSSPELQAFIQEELLNNPVLELDEEEDADKILLEKAQYSELTRDDAIDWDQYIRDRDFEPFPRLNFQQMGDSNSYDYHLSRQPSLQEHLIFQLGLCRLDVTQKRIGEFLIGNIDQNGYLKGDVDEYSFLLGVEPKEVLAILETIHKFDPSGTGARNLKECLLLQLSERTFVHPLASKIIENYLVDVAENRFKKIAADLGVDVKEVQAAVDFIRTLDPKPGRLIGDNSEVRYISADVIVEKVASDYVVLMNETSMPRLTINAYYSSIIGKEDEESITSSFIKNKLNSAFWLLRSIEQRRLTLYKVTECIVKMQRAFLDNGIKLLKPMTLKQVAEEIGVHESTVSRSAANKYVQTPRGLYPLKFFFASGVDDEKGDSISSESVKSHLRELIQTEDMYHPLSDQKLVELLQEKGVVISRRTIAKYRDELTIPSSNKRKRH